MTFRPRSRTIAALIALFSMLFMQLALAGYNCPSVTVGKGGTSDGSVYIHNADVSIVQMNNQNCHGTDKVLPNLCDSHAQAGAQSLDKPNSPPVQAFVAGALSTVFRELDVAAMPVAQRPKTFYLSRTTAPPLAIQHCCFRI